MKLNPEVLATWTELEESFTNLKRVMSQTGSLAIMSDQLGPAKALEQDITRFLAKLREARRT